MRVLLSFPYALGRVGVGRTAQRQAEGLAALGHEVFVAAPLVAAGAGLDPRVTVHETLRLAGRRIPARLLRATGARAAIHDRRAARWLGRLHRDAPLDVLHAWPMSGIRTMRAARARGTTVVREAPNTHTGHAYDVVEQEAARLGLEIPAGNSHRRDPAHLAAEQREWDLADAILAPSDAVAESFLDRGFAPDRVVRHRYGCDPGPVPPRDEPDRPLRAVFLGAVEPRKGVHHALRSWADSAASEEGTLTIAGRWMDGYRERLADLRGARGVVEAGFVEDPSALLADADVLLLPSVEEGSAIVTYEAQAAGCIPLVSRQAGAFATDGVHALLHEAGDTATLTAHLDLLHRDPALRARMRAACLEDRDRLGWDAAATALADAYAVAGRRAVRA